jgi:hypothetical protein
LTPPDSMTARKTSICRRFSMAGRSRVLTAV